MSGYSVARVAIRAARLLRGAWGSGVVVLTVLALCAASLSVRSPPQCAASQSGPIRILILGDSVTSGSIGDWTWRYRLWRHLVDAGVEVDFVGPVSDVFDRSTGTYGSHAYADPAFDQDHAARWGNALGWPAYSVSEIVSDYQPDVLLELLGVNDFNGLHATVAMVDRGLTDLVVQARTQCPDIAVVLGGLGSDWIDQVPAFNAQLPALAAELDTPESRVVAAAGPHLVRDVDTYEFVHPSATGEVKIAAAFADALSVLGIGPPAERPLPVVVNGPRQPTELTGTPGDHEIRLAWTLPLGADRIVVERRDLGCDQGWQPATDPVVFPSLSVTLGGLTNGDRYRVRVRAAKGTAVAEDVVSAVVRCRPGVPLAVPSLTVGPRHHGFRATWGRAVLATSYRVCWWRAGQAEQERSRTTSALGLRVHGLVSGRSYVVTVRGVRGGFLGPPRHTEVVPHG